MYITHGLSQTRLYHTWKSMINRCDNVAGKHYKDYGGRGIKVYSKWRNFLVFKQWSESNGYKENLQIDRIDNDKGYCPSNCRFVTHIVNNNNKRGNHRIVAFGEEKTIAEWSRDKRCKVSYKSLLARINDHKYNPENAICDPLVHYGKTSKYYGVSKKQGKYEASFCINKKSKYLGVFFSERAAAAMHNIYAYSYQGEKAKLNDLRA
jgi:hypothetical protein